MNRPQIDDELEKFRQFVINALRTPNVEQPAEECLKRLRELYSHRKPEFTSEDIRWINVLKGFLHERIDAHRQRQVDPSRLQPRARCDRRRGGDEAYWKRIRETLNSFCLPSDQLYCPRVFRVEGQTCKMCGYWPINWNHVLRNGRTSEELVVGSECIVNYKDEMARMGHRVLPIIFKSPGAAKYLNRKCPGIAILGDFRAFAHHSYPDPDVGEFYEDEEDQAEREMLMDLGLDPDDPDFTDLAPHGMSGDEENDEYDHDD